MTGSIQLVPSISRSIHQQARNPILFRAHDNPLNLLPGDTWYCPAGICAVRYVDQIPPAEAPKLLKIYRKHYRQRG